MEVFLKCLARFSAIADFPEPQTPRMNINLLPFSILSRTSFTISAWVLLFEKVRGFRHSPVLFRIDSELEVFLYNDHILFLFNWF